MKWNDFINREFVKFQSREGRPMLKTDFAEYLGVDLATLSHWLNNRRAAPSDTLILDKLAEKLGTDVYTAADRPARMPNNASLARIARVLPTVPPEVQETFARWFEEAAETVNDPEVGSTTLSFHLQLT